MATKFLNLSTDTTLGGVSPSDELAVSQKAIKTYVDSSIPTVNNPTITITQGGVTKGSFTLNQASSDTIALDAGGGGGSSTLAGLSDVTLTSPTDGQVLTYDNGGWINSDPTGGYHPDLFDWKWADHEINDMQWLRADTFSWQSGAVYEVAYQHLRDDFMQYFYAWVYTSGGGDTHIWTPTTTPSVGDHVYYVVDGIMTEQSSTITAISENTITLNGVDYEADFSSYMNKYYPIITPQTETIAGITVTYYQADDGHKICPVTQESNVVSIYTATGVAWYYILDTANQRFKLPRSNHNKYAETLSVAGTGVAIGLNTSATANTLATNNMAGSSENALFESVGTSTNHRVGLETDGTKSGIIAQQAQDADQYKYLYFYVGSFTQTAIENTAGLNASLFNGKADLDLSNVLANIDFVVESQLPTAGNNYTWYRKYKSGWVEQGGYWTNNSNMIANITFPIEMSDTNYTATGIMDILGDAGTYVYFQLTVYARNTTGVSIVHRGGSSGAIKSFSWQVSGMAAS